MEFVNVWQCEKTVRPEPVHNACLPMHTYLIPYIPVYLPTYIHTYLHTVIHMYIDSHIQPILFQPKHTRVGWARASITQQQRRPALHWILVTSWKLTQQSKQKSWLVLLFATSIMVYIKDSGEEALITFWNYILYNSKLPMNSLHAVLH